MVAQSSDVPFEDESLQQQPTHHTQMFLESVFLPTKEELLERWEQLPIVQAQERLPEDDKLDAAFKPWLAGLITALPVAGTVGQAMQNMADAYFCDWVSKCESAEALIRAAVPDDQTAEAAIEEFEARLDYLFRTAQEG